MFSSSGFRPLSRDIDSQSRYLSPNRLPSATERLPQVTLTAENRPDRRMIAVSFPPRHPSSQHHEKQWGCLCKPSHAVLKNVFP